MVLYFHENQMYQKEIIPSSCLYRFNFVKENVHFI